MNKNYIFFTRNTLPQPQAHLVQVANSANAAANLGYPTVLVCLQTGLKTLNPVKWSDPFRPQKLEKKLVKFYNLDDKLKVAPLPMNHSFCFSILALGSKYQFLAKNFAEDLEKYSQGTTVVIGTDNPDVFKDCSNVFAFKLKKRGILHCYHGCRVSPRRST